MEKWLIIWYLKLISKIDALNKYFKGITIHILYSQIQMLSNQIIRVIIKFMAFLTTR